MNDTFGPTRRMGEPEPKPEPDRRPLGHGGIHPDPFASLADITLTSYCTDECDHADDEEACGPPVIQPLTGYDAFLAAKYGNGGGIHSPGGPGL